MSEYSAISDNQRLYLPSGYVLREQGETFTVFHPVFPRWVVVNASAVPFLEACDGATFKDICLNFSRISGLPLERIISDLEPFYRRMLDLGILGLVPFSEEYSPNPKSAFIHLLDTCNLRPDRALFRETSDVISFFKDLGGNSVVLSGGEPLLFPDIETLLKDAASLFPTVTIATNGTCITDKIAELLASLGVKVQVSIDGGCAEVHDAVRGVGAFKKAVRGIKRLVKNGIKPTLSATILNDNYHNLLQIVPLAEELGAANVRFIPMQDNGRGKESVYSASRDEAFMDKLYSFMAEYSGSVSVTGGCDGLGIFNREEHTKKRWCNVGGKIIVDVDGKLYPCALLMEKAHCVGDLQTESLCDILHGEKFVNFCKSCHMRNQTIAACVSCCYKGICQSGCAGHAFHARNSILAVDRYCQKKA